MAKNNGAARPARGQSDGGGEQAVVDQLVIATVVNPDGSQGIIVQLTEGLQADMVRALGFAELGKTYITDMMKQPQPKKKSSIVPARFIPEILKR